MTAIHDLTHFSPMKHRQAVGFHRVDEILYSRVADAAPVLPESIGRISRSLGSGKSEAMTYSFDTFAATYKHDPKMSGLGSPIAKDVIGRVMKHEKYAELRSATVGDEVASALATVSLTTAVAELLPQELKQKAEEERKAREKAEDANTYAEEIADDGEATAQEVAEARAAAKKARDAAQQAAAALATALRDNGEKISAAVSKGVGAATDAASAVQSSGNAFGVGSFDPSGSMDIASRMQLAKMVQNSGPAFRELLRIIGRLLQDRAEKSSKRFAAEAGDVAEVAQGSDVDRLLDEEVSALADKDDVIALARFADDSMMQVEVEARETAVKGDVIILLDESGSMSAPIVPGSPATRESEAKGITIAIAHAMLREKRTVKVLFFQSEVTKIVDITPADVTARENGMPVASRKLAEIASRGTGGWTLFDAPLTEAMDVLASGKMTGADVMMITDGYSTVSDSVAERVKTVRQKHGVTFYAMAISKDARAAVPVFERFADRVFSGDSLLAGAKELVELL